ncbi:hypothetical protein [Yersinia kristensenii]
MSPVRYGGGLAFLADWANCCGSATDDSTTVREAAACSSPG